MTSRAGTALLVGAILLPAAVRLVCYPGYPGSDDAFIHYAVASNVATDRGWGIQPGESVNLSSSPLFTLTAAGLVALGGDPWRSGSWLTLLAACAGVWLTWWAARRLGLDGVPAALLAATNLHLWRWTGTFLETTLAWAAVPLVVGLGGPVAGRREWSSGVWTAVGGLLAAATLLRYELALLLVAFAPQAWIAGRRPRGGWLAAGLAAVTVPGACFAWHEFGTLVPTTLVAKSSSSPHWPSPSILEALGRVVLSAAPGALLLIVWGLGARWRRGGAGELWRWTVRWLPLWLPPFALALFYSVEMDVLQSPGRYFLPFTSLLALLALAALPGGARGGLGRAGVAFAVVLQATVALGVTQRRVAPVLRGMESGYVTAMREAASELRLRCRPGEEVLVLTDIGVLSVAGTEPCRILDGGGLASPELIGLAVPEMIERHRPAWVLESLGDPLRPLPEAAAMSLEEIWRREFPSHGIARPDRRFVTRLFAARRTSLGAAEVPG